MNNDVTIVTALFNINRDKLDGRDWNTYLKWFSNFLKLKAPLIIFTSKDLNKFITSRRNNLNTKILTTHINEIPYFYLFNQIKEIINSEKFLNNVKDINRIECKDPLYLIIQFSKFFWLKQAAFANYFNSKQFLWLDAGSSRFFDNYNFKTYFPSTLGKNVLGDIEDTFLVQMNYDCYPDLYNKSKLGLDYLYDNRSFVLGSLFGGNKIIIDRVFELVEDLLLNKMIKNGFINNDQVALAYLIKNYPELFSIYCRKDKKHLSLFSLLSQT